MSLESIRIVMVRTFHPGNIGAVARAMKNMGLTQLTLVAPVTYPSEEAVNRAAGATDILQSASVVNTVEEAIADAHLVIATSARQRRYKRPLQSAREAMQKAYSEVKAGAKVAILLGPERSGLSNQVFELADIHTYIPAHPEYSSLNVAAAMQILSYELWLNHCCFTDPVSDQPPPILYPQHRELEIFYRHCHQVLNSIGFINPKHTGDVMVKLRQFLARARIRANELKILRGIFSAIEPYDKNK